VDEALAASDALLAEQEAVLHRRAAELEERAARIVQLEIACDSLSGRVVRREQELDDVRADLERLRAEGERGTRSLLLLAEEIEAVRKQARGQATRIRMRALRDAVELGERIGELARDPGGAGERLFESLQGAIASIAAGEGSGLEGLEQPPASHGRANGSAAELFDGAVEIEVGPLDDFSQLVGFEDAAGGIAATSQISVKRFASGRATLEMKLAEPVKLLRELEERTPFEFKVRDLRADRLVLDVDHE
jgi:hypothetical protein